MDAHPPLRVLALDVSWTATGCAWPDPDGSGRPLTRTIKVPKDVGTFEEGLGWWLNAVARLVMETRPTVIAYERQFAGTSTSAKAVAGRTSFAASAKLNGLTVLAAVVAVQNRLKPLPCHISSVRKHFIGVGNMKGSEAKKLVMRHCMSLRWPPTNLDESDACAIWSYATAAEKWSAAVGRGEAT